MFFSFSKKLKKHDQQAHIEGVLVQRMVKRWLASTGCNFSPQADPLEVGTYPLTTTILMLLLLHSAIFMETSSKDGRNILDSLVMLAREMCASEDVEVRQTGLKISQV